MAQPLAFLLVGRLGIFAPRRGESHRILHKKTQHMPTNKLLVVLGLCFLLGLEACKTAQPTAPTANYNGQAFKRVQEISVLNIPIEIPAPELAKTINNQIGNVIFEDNSLDDNGGDNMMLKVTKRAPIQITPIGNTLSIIVPVNIWARFGYKVEKLGLSLSKYEDTDFGIDIKFSTRVGINSDWLVTTATTGNGFNWVKKPVIEIVGFTIPIDKIVGKIIDDQQPEIARIIDNQVKGRINLKPYVSQAWNQVQTPLLLNDQYRTWLKVTPQELQMTPLAASGTNLRTQIGLKAITETVTGDKPEVKSLVPVPNLKTVPQIAELFEVALVGKVSYGEASRLAFEAVKNQVFEFSNGKKKVTVTAVEIYGQGEQMIAAVTLVGSLNAKVFLRGKPVFDPASRSLVMTELDFDLDTRNKLVKAANWLAHGQFLKAMTPYFKMPLGPQLDEAKSMIQKNLANNKINDQITLKGNLNTLEPDKIYVTPEGLEAVINAKGKLGVELKGF